MILRARRLYQGARLQSHRVSQFTIYISDQTRSVFTHTVTLVSDAEFFKHVSAFLDVLNQTRRNAMEKHGSKLDVKQYLDLSTLLKNLVCYVVL
ncbi:hypothetical protein EB796_024563 [Bugula neritina]|uniref:Uncharacterized protein n=1 Tax=Bugula neritina TaxID=10212 RepID=A0A7J7IT61_BUGNE|nr:hypothetical protein EB796_024563 [Bugula neritina]